MRAINNPFTKLINGTTQFVIPVFQRDYSWTEDQNAQLWNDVLHIASADSDQHHFLGSIVYISTGDSTAGFTRWLLIDGQQRMTSLALLLIALRDHINEDEWEGSTEGLTPTKIDRYFLLNPEETGDKRHKLVLRRHDQATLRALLDGKATPEEASERLVESYEFFRENLKDADPDEVYRGIGKLVVVDVTLDRLIDDPQLIFESLNSTGMDLSQSDLIRNFILMGLPEQQQTRLYEEYWARIESLFRGSDSTFDAYARDFLALKTKASKQVKGSEIYRAFRRYFPQLESESGGLEGALAEMLRYARYHAAFSLGAETKSTLLDQSLRQLRRLVENPATLIMRLFDCYDRLSSLSEEEFIEALGIVESYIMRRAISGLQTRGYWQIFANISYKISSESPLTDLKVGLARQHENYRFPSDADFTFELEGRDLYGMRVCHSVLDRLENFQTNEPTDTSGYTIEHIMPQNYPLPAEWRTMLGKDWEAIQKTWVHRLGNLTLTGYNSTYSDRPFEEKKSIEGGFEESAVRLNKYVREQEVWTEVQMQERGELLANKALTIWTALEVDRQLIEAAQVEEKREQAAKRDPSKVKMSATARGLFEELSRAVRALDGQVIELAENKSVSYHGPQFFLEVLPREHKLKLLLPLEIGEVEDQYGLAEDASQRKFFFYAKYAGDVAITITKSDDIPKAVPVIQQALVSANS
jgi:uncharacterized protein with ParB-like and HNH nuclease domain/predicted transport protein